ncbi:uncharacterized protein LOC130990390 [Salvia miltiorrhiza]|uniref:uncharacterized protein LOC130990390 n=1 Tax=Salvia miltiorrhiza TaxID=226208 RepID=UPI0025ACD03B|nr:uncharacterized protein LOC130990390 [Salvia miltiorrhiza]
MYKLIFGSSNSTPKSRFKKRKSHFPLSSSNSNELYVLRQRVKTPLLQIPSIGVSDQGIEDIRCFFVGCTIKRTRKGHISMNTLGVCDWNLKFVYVLSGWEGSAADSCILRDALNRPHGLRVPKGNIIFLTKIFCILDHNVIAA